MARFTSKDLDLLIKGGLPVEDPYSALQKKAAEIEKGMNEQPAVREHIITMNLDAYELVVGGMMKRANMLRNDGNRHRQEPHPSRKKTEQEISREEELGRETGVERTREKPGEQSSPPATPAGNPAREADPETH